MIQNYKNESLPLYILTYFNGIFFLIVLLIISIYSFSDDEKLKDIKYERHCPPGTSYGKNLKKPTEY